MCCFCVLVVAVCCVFGAVCCLLCKKRRFGSGCAVRSGAARCAALRMVLTKKRVPIETGAGARRIRRARGRRAVRGRAVPAARFRVLCFRVGAAPCACRARVRRIRCRLPSFFYLPRRAALRIARLSMFRAPAARPLFVFSRARFAKNSARLLNVTVAVVPAASDRSV